MNTAYYDMLILLQQQTQALIRSNAPKAALNQRILESDQGLQLASRNIKGFEVHAIVAE